MKMDLLIIASLSCLILALQATKSQSWLSCDSTIKTAVGCQNSTANLVCPFGSIHVLNASFGRHTTGLCPPGFDKPDDEQGAIACHAPTSFLNVFIRARCEGRDECTIEASSKIFGEPCPGTYKYLAIDYICRGFVNSTAVEHRVEATERKIEAVLQHSTANQNAIRNMNMVMLNLEATIRSLQNSMAYMQDLGTKITTIGDTVLQLSQKVVTLEHQFRETNSAVAQLQASAAFRSPMADAAAGYFPSEALGGGGGGGAAGGIVVGNGVATVDAADAKYLTNLRRDAAGLPPVKKGKKIKT